MDPAFQSAFNVVKGSVPARTDVSDAAFDDCGKKGMADVKEASAKGTLLGSLAHGHAAPAAVKNAFYDVITATFNGQIDRPGGQAAGRGGRRRQVAKRVSTDPRRPAGSRPRRGSPASGERRSPGRDPIVGTHAAIPARQDSGAARRLPAAPRAGAQLRGGHRLRLRLHPVHRLSLLHRFQNPAELRFRGVEELRAALVAAELVDRAGESHHLRQPLYRHLLGAGPRARDPARPEDPRRRRAAADLPLSDGAVLHRHRHGLEVVPRPRHRHRAHRAALGLQRFHLRLDQGHPDGDLLRRHRRRLAILGLRHGDVPGRAARHRQRDHQGGADRRRHQFQALPAHHHPAAAARSSCRPSWCSRIWRSSPTTWWSR